jgi:SAM-dependent methyltransferase
VSLRPTLRRFKRRVAFWRDREQTERMLLGAVRHRGRPIALNANQQAFCEWNAQRLGISLDESRRRFAASAQALRGGHGGVAFRTFNDVAHSLYQVFASDAPSEVFEAYRLHSPAHFLRTLSYDPPRWRADHPLLEGLHGRDHVTVVDFGCGLAQPSLSLARALRERGCEVSLVLADIPTLRFEFVGWLARREGFEVAQRPCTPDERVPELRSADVLIAREFFEHVHEPVWYLDRLDRYLAPGGFLVTNVEDHHQEFMHVSPDLAPLRARLRELGYEAVVPQTVFRKR